MDNKGISPELMQKARRAKSPDDLAALAREHGLSLSPKEAQDCFRRLHHTGELQDEELENVSGGGCGRNGQEDKNEVDAVTSAAPKPPLSLNITPRTGGSAGLPTQK